MKSDVLRAGLAVIITLVLSTGAVQAAPWLKSKGYWPQAFSEPEDRLYTIINLTEDPDAYMACPVDENLMRSRIENELASRAIRGVYTPLGEGPDVMTHEIEARLDERSNCLWTGLVRFRGEISVFAS